VKRPAARTPARNIAAFESRVTSFRIRADPL
jgi:hypothetical protein